MAGAGVVRFALTELVRANAASCGAGNASMVRTDRDAPPTRPLTDGVKYDECGGAGQPCQAVPTTASGHVEPRRSSVEV